MSIVIKIDNLSKQYRLGLVSTRTLSHDLNRWWTMNIRGKEDPYLKIGETAQGTEHRAQGETKRRRDEETARPCNMYNRRCIIGDVKTIGNYQ